MNILGINSAYHESSACLIQNGKLVAAVEEERFSRIKHAKEATVTNPNELPYDAILYCLNKGGIDLKDVDYIGYSMLPEKRKENINYEDIVIEGDWGSISGEEYFYNKLQTIPSILEEKGFIGEFVWLSHHLCHAASSYYASPFQEANIIVVDGIAETASTLIARAEGTRITSFKEIYYPDSLGFLWEKISLLLGFTEYDACKVMGLAAFGNPKKYSNQFNNLVHLLPDGSFSIDNTITRFRSGDLSKLEHFFSVKHRMPNEPMKEDYMDIASSLQQVTENVMLHLANYAYNIHPSCNLCMAGGTALNCVANGKVTAKSPYTNLYVAPAANDAGTALGAALLIFYSLSDRVERIEIDTAYLGPEFNDDTIERILKTNGMNYFRVEEIENLVAQKISEGAVISWFQGSMEFGPRALGNRSLLADPRDPSMREKLNILVKHREDFRPFAPSVLSEEADKWFEIDKEVAASEYMLVGYMCKPERRSQIPAVVHVDGTSRIQRVYREKNRRYYKLIESFYKITDVPILLNTSFNDQEPIVCSPEDAIRTFIKTKIDYLAIGNFLVSRKDS